MKKFVNYVVAFFLLIGFTVTCNFLLFFTYIDMEPHEVRFAALVTFGNVLLLAVIFGVADSVRRYFTVKRPVKKIQKGIDQIIGGDFKHRFHIPIEKTVRMNLIRSSKG